MNDDEFGDFHQSNSSESSIFIFTFTEVEQILIPTCGSLGLLYIGGGASRLERLLQKYNTH